MILSYPKDKLWNMEYLIIVDYKSDAERKRIDYAFGRWKDRAEIEKPRGAVIRYGGENINDFLDDLYPRTSHGRESVHVFAGETYSPDIPEQVRTLKYTTKTEESSVRDFMKYILTRIGAVLHTADAEVWSYTANTKKGRVNIDISIKTEDVTLIMITARGYGEVVAFILDKLKKEMDIYLKI